MHVAGKPVGFWSAVSMGIGAMVGGGIFALLGEAGAISGPAVWLSFILGGLIALASGYSLARLGARYPSAGGIVEYLGQAFGVGPLTGSLSVLLYAAAIVSLSVIAKAFGNYAVALLPVSGGYWAEGFTVAIVMTFLLVNYRGAADVAVWERVTVAIKFLVLSGLTIAGLATMDPALLSPRHYPAPASIVYSLAITFFAYEGFRVITNAAEDMPDPARILPRAMLGSILVVMVLYVAVACAAFGSLPAEQIIAAREFALAEVARPVFGDLGFHVVAGVALVSIASSINAALYASTNVAWQLARYGELPAAFGRPFGNSREGLLFSSIGIVVLALTLDMTEIATLGSVSVLFVHGITHAGHLRLAHETGASRTLIVLAILLIGVAIALVMTWLSERGGWLIWGLPLMLGLAFATELILQRLTGREVRTRLER
ncbi:MAG: amino acid permease [Gammaproteobacteria bacterium]|nr:MAG: amino acid permease [Gammaproteobacteria bacterium]